MTLLDQLKAMIENGDFHHATYRNQGTLWEGLHVYSRNSEGLRGYVHALLFLKNDPDLEKAIELTKHTGISVGSYGRG